MNVINFTNNHKNVFFKKKKKRWKDWKTWKTVNLIVKTLSCEYFNTTKEKLSIEGKIFLN